MLLHFESLVRHRITRRADRAIRSSVRISKVEGMRNAHRTMAAVRRCNAFEFTCPIVQFGNIAPRAILPPTLNGRHKSDPKNTVPIIETRHFNCPIIQLELSRQMNIDKRIAAGRSV